MSSRTEARPPRVAVRSFIPGFSPTNGRPPRPPDRSRTRMSTARRECGCGRSRGAESRGPGRPIRAGAVRKLGSIARVSRLPASRSHRVGTLSAVEMKMKVDDARCMVFKRSADPPEERCRRAGGRRARGRSGDARRPGTPGGDPRGDRRRSCGGRARFAVFEGKPAIVERSQEGLALAQGIAERGADRSLPVLDLLVPSVGPREEVPKLRADVFVSQGLDGGGRFASPRAVAPASRSKDRRMFTGS